MERFSSIKAMVLGFACVGLGVSAAILSSPPPPPDYESELAVSKAELKRQLQRSIDEDRVPDRGMARVHLVQASPVSEAHAATVSRLETLGYPSGNVSINGLVGRYIVSSSKFVEWIVSPDGLVTQIIASIDGQQGVNVLLSYTLDGSYESMTFQLYQDTPILLSEVERDIDGTIIGHWDNYSQIYTPITPPPPFSSLLALTYEDCMRKCNLEGRQCTEKAKMKLSKAVGLATGAIVAGLAGGAVAGTIAPGVGTIAGALGGATAGVITAGLTMAFAHSEYQMEMRHCRETYNLCARTCKQLKTKDPDDNNLESANGL